MDQEKIRAVIKAKVAELSVLSEKIGDGFDKEPIHKFRVAVKSLRSFLRLLRTQPNTPSLKMPKSFKRLYQIAGAIRDAQLEMEQLAGKQPELPHYMDKLHKMIERQKSEWGKCYSKKVLNKLEDRLIAYKYTEIDDNVLTAFFNLKMTSVDELNKTGAPTDNQVHQARKEVKDILYVSKLTKKKWKTVYKQQPCISVKNLKQFADVLGDYNDKRINLEHLSSFSSRTMESEEKDTIRNICIENTKELKIKKKSIMEMVKGLYRPLQPQAAISSDGYQSGKAGREVIV